MEFVVEKDGAGLLVGAEEAFDGGPELARRLLIAAHGKVEYRVIDGAEDPAAYAAVRLIPLGPERIGGLRRWRRCAA